MYRINYAKIMNDPAWRNFCDPWFNMPIEDKTPLHKWTDAELRKHNGRDGVNTPDIEFETEEDFIIFKLKFS